MKVLFGEDYVYCVGMIGIVVEKIVYGYVKGYVNDYNLMIWNVEIDCLVVGCIGVKCIIG